MTKSDDRRRPERVASRVREELSLLLRKDMDDPRLADVTLSRVSVTDDLSVVTVRVEMLVDDPGQHRAEKACKVLNSLERALRMRLAPRLAMRRVPQLKFVVDRGAAAEERLDALLHEVSLDLARKPPGDAKA